MPLKSGKPKAGAGLTHTFRTSDPELAQRVWEEADRETNRDLNAALIRLVKKGVERVEWEKSVLDLAKQHQLQNLRAVDFPPELGRSPSIPDENDLPTLTEIDQKVGRDDGIQKGTSGRGNQKDREDGKPVSKRGGRSRR